MEVAMRFPLAMEIEAFNIYNANISLKLKEIYIFTKY